MAPSGWKRIRYRTLRLRTDQRRAIDRYIDFFGDRAVPGTEQRATRVPSVDAQPSHGKGRGRD